MPNVSSFTTEERIFMSETYNREQSAERVRTLYRETFPGRRVPTKTTIISTRNRFLQTGNVNPSYEVRYPSRQIPEEVEVQVCAAAELDHFASEHTISLQVGYSKSTIHRIFKRFGYKAYKPQKHQAILTANNDPERRMNFSENMTERINNNGDLLGSICFSDECRFPIHHAPNRQNTRYRSSELPTVVFDVNTQYQQSLNVWAGMLGTDIIGPFFIAENSINADRYLQLLQEEVVPAIRRVEERNRERGIRVSFNYIL